MCYLNSAAKIATLLVRVPSSCKTRSNSFKSSDSFCDLGRSSFSSSNFTSVALGTGETLELNKSATGTPKSSPPLPNISSVRLSSTLLTSTPSISSTAVTSSTSSPIRLIRLARRLFFLTAWSTECLSSLSARPVRTSAAAAIDPNLTLLLSTFSR